MPSRAVGKTPGTTGTHIASCFLNRAGGNRRNNGRAYPEIRGTLSGTESSLFRIFPDISAYFRISGKNIWRGKQSQCLRRRILPGTQNDTDVNMANTRLDATPENWSILRNVTKIRYGDLARNSSAAKAV
jgi:hypothetical protein